MEYTREALFGFTQQRWRRRRRREDVKKSAIHKFKETNKKKELCASGSSSGLLKNFARVHWQQESHMVIDIPASVVAFLRNPAPKGQAGPLNLLSDNRFRAAFCATQSETHFWCVLFHLALSLSPCTLSYWSHTIFSGVVNSASSPEPCLSAETLAFVDLFRRKIDVIVVVAGDARKFGTKCPKQDALEENQAGVVCVRDFLRRSKFVRF